MPLNWNEIRHRALEFSKDWKDAHSEAADAKSFWDSLFLVFGIPRRRVASFEVGTRRHDNTRGYIDLLWKGTLLVEHKSRGHDLTRAYDQARDYFSGLKDAELPGHIVVCNFEKFRLYELDSDTVHEFSLDQLHENVQLFGFLLGYQRRNFRQQDPVNISAANLMGELHERLRSLGYSGHQLEMLMVRLLFCLFADDTGIFEKDTFLDILLHRSRDDGADLGGILAHVFEVLDTPINQRMRNLDELFASLPYVNGALFSEKLPVASFDSQMRSVLIECSYLNWSKISPEIFGSLFQAAMDPAKRRHLGAHYTSEVNILKALQPLILDELRAQFETSRRSAGKLRAFHDRLANLRFFDPACGCGNFLIVTYREIRRLEIETLLLLQNSDQRQLDVSRLIRVNVDQFFGIEIEEFPARIAEVALWLIDHQMNLEVSEEFGLYFARLPLNRSAHIYKNNALRVDWHDVVEPTQHLYIISNPPFVGAHLQSPSQKEDLTALAPPDYSFRELDYVAGWYIKAARYMANSGAVAAFVSTNSITQGEQVALLWGVLLPLGVAIRFAHRTFRWSNSGSLEASVFCVIVGFGLSPAQSCRLFEYLDPDSEPHEVQVSHINPYLINYRNVLIHKRSTPVCPVPNMKYGNKPTDGGYLVFSSLERDALLAAEPRAAEYVRPYVGAREFLKGEHRYCLWLVDAKPDALQSMPRILQILEKVRASRLQSKKLATRILAESPARFEYISQPKSSYLIVPQHTSENRKYIPLGFMSPDVIASNACSIIPDANLFHFGVLSSAMHMAWIKYTCGRIKGDFRYSGEIVYNTFPWPLDLTEKQRSAIIEGAQGVLDVRSAYPASSLSDLYDPLSMPDPLRRAHAKLDSLVDKAYRRQGFDSERVRIEFLFQLYEKYTGSDLPGLSPLGASTLKKPK